MEERKVCTREGNFAAIILKARSQQHVIVNMNNCKANNLLLQHHRCEANILLQYKPCTNANILLQH